MYSKITEYSSKKVAVSGNDGSDGSRGGSSSSGGRKAQSV